MPLAMTRHHEGSGQRTGVGSGHGGPGHDAARWSATAHVIANQGVTGSVMGISSSGRRAVAARFRPPGRPAHDPYLARSILHTQAECQAENLPLDSPVWRVRYSIGLRRPHRCAGCTGP